MIINSDSFVSSMIFIFFSFFFSRNHVFNNKISKKKKKKKRWEEKNAYDQGRLKETPMNSTRLIVST